MSKYNSLVEKRETIVAKVKYLRENADAVSQSTDEKKRKTFLAKCAKLDAWTADHDKVVKEIAYVQQKPEEYEVSEFHLKINEFEDMVAEIRVVFDELKPPDINVMSNEVRHQEAAVSVKLPRISIPTFTGNISEWNSFFAIFQSLVDQNSALGDVQRLHYLRVSLQEEPLSLIKELELTGSNYRIAINLLKDRYENTRRIATAHADALMSLPVAQNPSAKHLRGILVGYREHVEALRGMKVIPPTFQNSSDGLFLFLILLRKLDPITRGNFERQLDCSTSVPTPERLIQFIERECQALEASAPLPSVSARKQHSEARNTYALTTQVSRKCVGCQGRVDHKLYQCSVFMEKAVSQRKRIVRDNKLCFNCLGDHFVINCPSSHACALCQDKHHTALHVDSAMGNPDRVAVDRHEERIDASDTNGAEETAVLTTKLSSKKIDVLATACVGIQNRAGQYETVRCLLDTGSQASYLTSSAAQRLGLVPKKTGIKVMGLAQKGVSVKGTVSISVRHRLGGPALMCLEALVLNRITGNLPSSPLPLDFHTGLEGITLADPKFHQPQPIEGLLGVDVFARCLIGRQVELGAEQPVLLNTEFGWVVMGAFSSGTSQNMGQLETHHAIMEPDVDHTLRKFWEVEEAELPVCSKYDRQCEEHFSSTHTRDTEGKYVVRLPFKTSDVKLGNSKLLAQSRFLALEKRLSKNSELYDAYRSFMDDYLQVGHMEACNMPEDDEEHYYMPHHAVVKPTSSTTRVRVVFDASAKTSSGSRCSLNDILHSGPKLQNDIMQILIKFRVFPIAVTADIRQMFRNIWVHPEDRNYQLILWRNRKEDCLQTFRLKTVTFGITSSPYLAMRSVLQLVKDEGEAFPEASRVLKEDVFVDDIVTGTWDLDSALQLRRELDQLLGCAGFELRKWSSNSASLLEGMPEALKEIPTLLSPEEPLFAVLVNLKSQPFTKRGILSCVAQFYDPLGLLTPVVFRAKTFLKELWSLGLDWDSLLPERLCREWGTFIAELYVLGSVLVPRYLGVREGRLHGFCDASEKGYTAVVYFCPSGFCGVPPTILLAKSRVAPLRQITLPRLELCGAHLLAKLIKLCEGILASRITLHASIAWTDSTTVLAWIGTSPHLLKTFVANRVSEIQSWVSPDSWRHVPSRLNAADCASRGLSPAELLGCSHWFTGSSFLTLPEEEWPVNGTPPMEFSDLPERRLDSLNLLVSTRVTDSSFMKNFSTWTALVHGIAYVLRFVYNCRGRRTGLVRSGGLSLTEVRVAAMAILRCVQHEEFHIEFQALEVGEPCSVRVQRLAPFVDPAGLLRVGGRISNSELRYAAKHPILLPKDHHLTILLIDHYHRIYMHAGPRLLQSMLVRSYWILSCRSVVRSRIHKCITCFKHRPTNAAPLMADLPDWRVRQVRPFLATSIDFAGPFLGKTHKRSQARCKLYLCVFVCCATKAVHLEAVSDLTSAAFLACLQRFVSRRGLCRNIYTDGGTNFVGASAELRRVSRFLQESSESEVLLQFARSNGIAWHFQPPDSPHFGGLHEAAVKLAKHHLRRVVGNQVLTFEEYSTIFARIEAILNSRPLCPLSEDPSEFDALTPGHFLIGAPLVSLHDGRLDLNAEPVTRWKLLQHMISHFWSRWQREYLHTLIQRSKWFRASKNLAEGTLVILQEDGLPPQEWRLAKIVRVCPGKDGIMRVVHLKTSSGALTRPAVKVFPLPMN